MVNEQPILNARKKIGKRLKRIRDNKKLTYYGVAKLSGLSIEQVQSIENGDKAYTIDSFIKIIRAIDPSFLYGK